MKENESKKTTKLERSKKKKPGLESKGKCKQQKIIQEKYKNIKNEKTIKQIKKKARKMTA